MHCNQAGYTVIIYTVKQHVHKYEIEVLCFFTPRSFVMTVYIIGVIIVSGRWLIASTVFTKLVHATCTLDPIQCHRLKE